MPLRGEALVLWDWNGLAFRTVRGFER